MRGTAFGKESKSKVRPKKKYALAGESVSSGRLIQDDTDDTPEQTVYENELPRKQVLTLQAHYIIIGFENVNL